VPPRLENIVSRTAVAQLLRETKVLQFCDLTKLMPVSFEMIVKQMLITESRARGNGKSRKYKSEQNAGNGLTALPRSCS
jgi:hypothetical protein